MKQKVILITGASSGLGKDFSLGMLREGHIVYSAARRTEKMKDIEAAGGRILPLDITQQSQIDQLVKTIIEKTGRIDVLINNAGYALYGAVETITDQEARDQFDVNIFGLANLTKAVIPHMRKQKSGRIINISSIGGKIYSPLGAWYHATKHALEGWSDCLRLELSPFNIDVVIIEPGIINTAFMDVLSGPLTKRSKGTPYEEPAKKVERSGKAIYAMGQSSPPSVITRLVSKAVNSKKPKTRYTGGKLARPMLFMRKILGDRLLDRIILLQIK